MHRDRFALALAAVDAGLGLLGVVTSVTVPAAAHFNSPAGELVLRGPAGDAPGPA